MQIVSIEPALSSERLIDLLMTSRFDIVHLVLPVDRRAGALIFDEVDTRSFEPAAGADVMPTEMFAGLLRESQSRLVVLATSYAFLVGIKARKVANMAAAEKESDCQNVAAWAGRFYRLIAEGYTVHEAFDSMRGLRDVRAIRQNRDVDFARRV